jgi:tRNA nucleotidyltransferase/poly(A) polymerase
LSLSAARFNFTLAEDLKDAASDEKVKSELGSKISRERIGHEVLISTLLISPFSVYFVLFVTMLCCSGWT